MKPTSQLQLVGYGRFGRALAELAHGAGLAVRAYDPVATVPERWCVNGLAELCAPSGHIVLAVPMGRFREVLESLRPLCGSEHTLVDVSSVKHSARADLVEVCGAEVPWVCTHPLFGPMSLALGERPLRVVVCPDTPHTSAVREVRALFERIGCTVSEQSTEAHDRSMADTHALAFFVAKGMLDIGVGDDEFVPPSFRAMAATIESVRADAGHLFVPIQNANPFAAEARERLLNALQRIHLELAEASSDKPSARVESRLAIPPREGQ